MCIIFIWRHSPSKCLESYRFILAANRDELFDRPAAHAQFWSEEPNILAGKDLTEGVEGGTWFGITKEGKIAGLTNIRNADPHEKAKHGRGMLIPNYLKSELNGKRYLESLIEERFSYRPFNLLAGNMLGDIYCISNSGKVTIKTFNTGFSCLTNSTLDIEWLKAKNGLKLFKETVAQSTCKKSLLDNLLLLLEDDTKHFPDPTLEDNELNQFMSSIFLPMHSHYGTRTNTIVLVDKDDKVTFLERTKTELNQKPCNWLTNQYEFQIEKP